MLCPADNLDAIEKLPKNFFQLIFCFSLTYTKPFNQKKVNFVIDILNN